MIDRKLQSKIASSKKSQLLLGARQVGKTTLLKSLPLVRSINLADESLFIKYAKDPSLLIREIKALKESGGKIAIDEVQRVPRILNSVQVLIDEKLPFQFILTGSSARKLKRGHANLLPGRIVVEYLDPLSVEEIGKDINIEDAMRFGTLPGIFVEPETRIETLGSYALTYLKEEIQAEALTREIGSYSRFLDVAASSSGQWINYSKLSNDAEIPKETVRRFFSILEETLVAFRIPPFNPKRSKRRISQRDRFVMFDVGVRNALLGLTKGEIGPTERGYLFEQFVILQSIYFSRSNGKGWSFYSYRTDGGAEVDLIIDAGDKYIAMECKSGRNANRAELTGFSSFKDVADKKVLQYVVYSGDTRQIFDDLTNVVPVKDFFLEEIQRF